MTKEVTRREDDEIGGLSVKRVSGQQRGQGEVVGTRGYPKGSQNWAEAGKDTPTKRGRRRELQQQGIVERAGRRGRGRHQAVGGMARGPKARREKKIPKGRKRRAAGSGAGEGWR
jgi:hypothetical protein